MIINEAIILAGGKGARLGNITKNVPKPMLDINGKPFLEYILAYLCKFGIYDVILSVGYKYNKIINYFGNSYKNMNIIYIKELNPLGTGGAIKKSINLIDNESVLILNGDTLFVANLYDLIDTYNYYNADMVIGLKIMNNASRYGSVLLKDYNKIIGFKEKNNNGLGLINSGLYIMNKNCMYDFPSNDSFSFEIDFLQKAYKYKNFYGRRLDGYFIDIGIKKDLEKARKDLSCKNLS